MLTNNIKYYEALAIWKTEIFGQHRFTYLGKDKSHIEYIKTTYNNFLANVEDKLLGQKESKN
ncbi:hypothetical protein F442_02999 [Phytophthora nicotianae P10297]|uniref:Uncharacterized protein n=2 Tax=Phytophthora nicotianae TaxID=4792 RepID=W2ZY24_PHYNI|nr:hypothetical protein F444_03066 [Phytophthora nicotianae P1976]ETP51920.1 hypothetical protein F442_02999 [Phytophthora nicotianae P10297]